ncbi:MAG: chloride channel protein [Catenisphaera adipataccumulans]|uniref:chloride channel protein n=1 Tax=Catenisphaera adipataccumulans TaxID=700500 RepID=UPI003D8BBD51
MPAYIKEIVHRNLNAARDSAVSLWIGLIVGVPVALAEVFYLKGITVIYDLRAVLGNWTLIGMPFAGLLIVYLMNTFGKDCNKGINHIFRIVQGKEHSLSLRVIPLMILTIWLSHLVGASVGRATGVIQIGVAIALWLGHMLHLDNDKIRLTVSGLAAGFACLFGIPRSRRSSSV